ncbi:MAG: hypothetical protein CM15mP120_04950 [Pseudomonadota bacterium]|nr:MAG: hypothetical protein CM15mP120_04950 [Pseudomonadota bacterium]
MTTPGPSDQFEAPKQHWPTPATPPPGSPNIVLMMLDDVGFADFGCYGSEIDTPCIDRVAARGFATVASIPQPCVLPPGQRY